MAGPRMGSGQPTRLLVFLRLGGRRRLPGGTHRKRAGRGPEKEGEAGRRVCSHTQGAVRLKQVCCVQKLRLPALVPEHGVCCLVGTEFLSRNGYRRLHNIVNVFNATGLFT